MDVPAPDQPKPPRVVVVDSDDLVRESLVGLLAIGRRVEVVGAAGDVRAALVVVKAMQPDVVVVDPRLPELAGGLDFVREAKRLAPRAAILVIGSADVVEWAVSNGEVDGSVRKTFRPDDLTAAIVKAIRHAAA